MSIFISTLGNEATQIARFIKSASADSVAILNRLWTRILAVTEQRKKQCIPVYQKRFCRLSRNLLFVDLWEVRGQAWQEGT
jgi:hypothetical protein